MTFTLSNGTRAFFNDWSKSTSYSVTERSQLQFENGSLSITGVYKWTNRPWYSYEYQKSRISAIGGHREMRIKELKTEFLNKKGLKRLGKKSTIEFNEIVQADSKIKLLDELETLVNNAKE